MNRKIFDISLIKTIIFNLHYFGLHGLKFPVLVSRKTVFKKLGGRVRIDNSSFGCVHLGFDAIGIFDYSYDRTIWENDGTILIRNKAVFGHGTRISNYGEIIFGKNFRVTANSSFICHKKISFGKNCLVSWNCRFMDTDFHKVLDLNSNIINHDESINVGDNVWVGSECIMLKGVTINNGCVVACNALLSGNIVEKENCIIGSLGKILRENIIWKP